MVPTRTPKPTPKQTHFPVEVGPETSTWNSSSSSSKRLHNFTFAPSFDLKWGHQRRLRCVKEPDSFSGSPSPSPSPPKTTLGGEGEDDPRAEVKQDTPGDTNGVRPWNLRTRRAVCKDPNNTGERCLSPVKRNVSGDGEVRPRPKFSVLLTKKEIEDDFIAMTGAKHVRRPKKRLKSVQRQLDAMFPGSWLSEITADMYKVDERTQDDGKK